MQDKGNKNVVNPLGKSEPEFKFDVGTVIFILIGAIVSWLNMLLIASIMEIWAYLTVIVISSIPGTLIALKNRFWGYGYMFGFTIAGIPFAFIVDIFVGWYTFFTTLFIFTIMWLIFWKTWRALSTIKRSSTNNNQ